MMRNVFRPLKLQLTNATNWAKFRFTLLKKLKNVVAKIAHDQKVLGSNIACRNDVKDVPSRFMANLYSSLTLNYLEHLLCNCAESEQKEKKKFLCMFCYYVSWVSFGTI